MDHAEAERRLMELLTLTKGMLSARDGPHCCLIGAPWQCLACDPCGGEMDLSRVEFANSIKPDED